MLKKFIIFLLFIAALFAGAFYYAQQQLNQFLSQPLSLQQQEMLTVQRGANINSVINQAIEANWVEASPFSQLVRRLHPELVDIKVGTFAITEGMTLQAMLELIVSGKEHQYSITFVEGSRFDEWRELLLEAQGLELVTTEMSEAEIAQELGIEQGKLEGLFLAETYNYTQGTSDLDILRRANRSLENHLDEFWSTKQDKLPLKSPYEALILASIIEKETSVAHERGLVSAVFINRLNRGMRLQTDPTVIYGMGEKYQGRIGRKGLDTPTPYNTYIINGLPPTPIAMVGKASLQAALNPEESDYIYFVASGKGGHVFSKTLAEHNRAVRAYLKHIRSN
ncbi:endolytic transglycosylase MltG [Vibrio astriarenae]|uniref:endolytic transglycosylase MltG n=1 Tax=Vibrio astriarenae TaxID=1481923 RepID=UPI003735624C